MCRVPHHQDLQEEERGPQFRTKMHYFQGLIHGMEHHLSDPEDAAGEGRTVEKKWTGIPARRRDNEESPCEII